jgi:protein-S-isoprenylcysteine O-methyltransferase Ste14
MERSAWKTSGLPSTPHREPFQRNDNSDSQRVQNIDADDQRVSNMSDGWTLVLLVIMFGLVCLRALQLKSQGVTAFTENAQNLLLVAPFLVGFIYAISALAFDLPFPSFLKTKLLQFSFLAPIGYAVSISGLLFLAYSLYSFGNSFRVGIDDKNPNRLVTTGAFGISRNPIYVAFGLVFGGIALVVPSLGVIVTLLVLALRIHIQVLREEGFLKPHYGDEYVNYCAKVRRYL